MGYICDIYDVFLYVCVNFLNLIYRFYRVGELLFFKVGIYYE